MKLYLKVVSGQKIQPVARKIGVHRVSIYIWRERAIASLEEALEPHKRGPKFKHPQKNLKENIEALREKINKLKGYLEEKERQIYALKQKLEPQKDDSYNSKPVRCPNCGCKKVYRNGTYKIKPK